MRHGRAMGGFDPPPPCFCIQHRREMVAGGCPSKRRLVRQDLNSPMPCMGLHGLLFYCVCLNRRWSRRGAARRPAGCPPPWPAISLCVNAAMPRGSASGGVGGLPHPHTPAALSCARQRLRLSESAGATPLSAARLLPCCHAVALAATRKSAGRWAKTCPCCRCCRIFHNTITLTPSLCTTPHPPTPNTKTVFLRKQGNRATNRVFMVLYLRKRVLPWSATGRQQGNKLAGVERLAA